MGAELQHARRVHRTGVDNGEQRDPGPQARHDPGLRRGEPDRPGHRHRGRALPRGPDQDPGARRLRRGATRLRRYQGAAPVEARARPPEGGERRPHEVPRRAARRRPLRLRARPDREGRRVRGRRAGRRDGHQQGPRLLRRDEAPQLLRPGRVARQSQESPGAGFDRRLRDAGARVQGHAHGGPVRKRAHDDTQPAGRRGRRRAQPAARTRRRSRARRRHRLRPQRGEVGGGTS